MITKTASTEQQYTDRARLLLAQAGRELINVSIGPADFARWLLARKPRIAHATWRLYRSAARYHLSTLPDGAAAAALLDADSRSRDRRDALSDASRERTSSAKKLTFFRHGDFQKLQVYLLHMSRSQYAKLTADWTRAGLATGLRPVEWGGARLVAEGGREVLRVQSAKATNGRGTGDWRAIDVTGLSQADLGAVRRMASRGLEWLSEERYATMQDRAGACLAAACDELWPGERRYALYSCRHQCIANLRSRMPLQDVQAIVGHADVSSTQGYGRGTPAWPARLMSTLPRPYRAAEPVDGTPPDVPAQSVILGRQRYPWRQRLFGGPALVAGRA